MPRKLTSIALNDTEIGMIDQIMKDQGQGSRSEVLRESLRHFYAKSYSKTSRTLKETDPIKLMSNEDYCTNILKGEVIVDRLGNRLCRIPAPNGQGSTDTSLEGIKSTKPITL